MKIELIGLLLASLLAAGCTCKTTQGTGPSGANSTKCEIDLKTAANCVANGNNVKGHVIFGNGVTLIPGSDIIIQWSTDSFATVTNVGVTTNNAQGFVAVPFSFCIDTGKSFQLRAFQADDKTMTYHSGEATGRYDGTDTGNAAYITTNLFQNQISDWPLLQGLEIVLDGSGPQ